MSKQLERPAHEIHEGPPPRKGSLWLITFSPTLWAVHFVACYVTAAVWCAKAGRDSTLVPVRLLIGAYTLVALLGIAWTAWGAYKQQGFGNNRSSRVLLGEPHDRDTAADRHRFLGFATLLLSGLSFVAVVFVGLTAVFVSTCR